MVLCTDSHDSFNWLIYQRTLAIYHRWTVGLKGKVRKDYDKAQSKRHVIESQNQSWAVYFSYQLINKKFSSHIWSVESEVLDAMEDIKIY